MKRITMLLLIGTFALLCTGFELSHEVTNAEQLTSTDQDHITSLSQSPPPTKTMPILIEGLEEKMVLKLHEAKFIGFFTYVPEDMSAESDERVFTVVFTPQGKRTDKVQLQILKLEASSASKARRQMISELEAKGFTVSASPSRRFGFSSDEYSLRKGELVGKLALFVHNDQRFAIAYHYPPEYGDGFEPRLEIILDELVWYESFDK